MVLLCYRPIFSLHIFAYSLPRKEGFPRPTASFFRQFRIVAIGKCTDIFSKRKLFILFFSLFFYFHNCSRGLRRIKKTLKCPLLRLYAPCFRTDFYGGADLIESVFSKTTWQISFVALQPKNVVAILIRIYLFVRINEEGLTS